MTTSLWSLLASKEQTYHDAISTKGGNGSLETTETTLTAGGVSIDVHSVERVSGGTGHYYASEYEKDLIVLHHTAGQLAGDLPALTADDHISTAFVVARSGRIYRLFDDTFWAHHATAGSSVHQRSIGIELSNYGWLQEDPLDAARLDTHFGDFYCTKDDTDAYIELDDAFRDHRYYATFTDEQIDALNRLLDYLCAKFDIPPTILPPESRYEVFGAADKDGYTGIASHVNYVASGKWDLGPAFPWDRLFASDVHLPIDLGAGTELTTAAIDDAYAHTERRFGGGYFPLGTNTVWHGGLHLHTGDAASSVHACARGRIVAARLAAEEAQADGYYGSRNFILTRHEDRIAARCPDVSAPVWYSLLMHLHPGPVDGQDARLEAFPWLRSLADSGGSAEPDGSDVLRETAIVWLSDGAGRELGRIATDTPIERLGVDGSWISVRFDPNHEGVTFTDGIDRSNFPTVDAWIAAADVGVKGAENERVRRLIDGELLALDIPVKAGEPLWRNGEYGSPRYRTGLLHWEIFSAENLRRPWTQTGGAEPVLRNEGWWEAEDPEGAAGDCNMDCRRVLELVEQDYFGRDDVLTFDEIRRFYESSPDAASLRACACRFVSEWGVDLDLAIPKLKGHWFTFHLKERMTPYLWWDEAIAAGVELPESRHVWHYNPIAFLAELSRKNEAAVAPAGGADDGS